MLTMLRSTMRSGAYLFRPMGNNEPAKMQSAQALLSVVKGPVMSSVQVASGDAYSQVQLHKVWAPVGWLTSADRAAVPYRR